MIALVERALAGLPDSDLDEPPEERQGPFSVRADYRRSRRTQVGRRCTCAKCIAVDPSRLDDLRAASAAVMARTPEKLL